VERPDVDPGRCRLSLFFIRDYDFDLDLVIERLEADFLDFSGVMIGRCLLSLPRQRRLLEERSLAAELKDP